MIKKMKTILFYNFKEILNLNKDKTLLFFFLFLVIKKFEIIYDNKKVEYFVINKE